LLFLEDLVSVGRLLERQLVRGKVLDAERIGIFPEQRDDLVDPPLDVRLLAAGLLRALIHEIDAEHLAGAAVERDLPAHLPDRTEAEHAHRTILGDRGLLDRLAPGNATVTADIANCSYAGRSDHVEAATGVLLLFRQRKGRAFCRGFSVPDGK
jgi:hypothetical protein